MGTDPKGSAPGLNRRPDDFQYLYQRHFSKVPEGLPTKLCG